MQNINLDATGIKDILSNIPKQKRSPFLVMTSSGLSLSDILDLTLKNIDFKSDYATITLQRKMSGHVFTTFISKEAAVALKQHIEERGITNPEEKIFNLNAKRLLTLWRKASETAGYEKIRLSELRKFFHKTLLINGVNETITDFLMGYHQNLADRHIEITREILTYHYNKIEPNLTIFT